MLQRVTAEKNKVCTRLKQYNWQKIHNPLWQQMVSTCCMKNMKIKINKKNCDILDNQKLPIYMKTYKLSNTNPKNRIHLLILNSWEVQPLSW